MKSMKSIRFKNPVFRSGFNTTFRFGIKDYALHENVYICDDNDLPLHIAEIVSIYYGMMYGVPDSLIEAEHDETAADYFALMRIMQEIYPTFEDADDVTVIGFVLND